MTDHYLALLQLNLYSFLSSVIPTAKIEHLKLHREVITRYLKALFALPNWYLGPPPSWNVEFSAQMPSKLLNSTFLIRVQVS